MEVRIFLPQQYDTRIGEDGGRIELGTEAKTSAGTRTV